MFEVLVLRQNTNLTLRRNAEILSIDHCLLTSFTKIVDMRSKAVADTYIYELTNTYKQSNIVFQNNEDDVPHGLMVAQDRLDTMY